MLNNSKPYFIVIILCLLINACSTPSSKSTSIVHTPFVCQNAAKYAGKAIGSGHCVALIQKCSGAPLTKYWRPSLAVKGNAIPPGSIIATFRNGRYPNRTGYHAAIYISQTDKGIWVWDQWVGKPVHKRLIRFKGGRGSASNDGDRYTLVEFVSK